MFEYFEGNYTWNMAVNIALGMGASIGDIDDVSRSLRAVAKNKDHAGAEQWFAAWNGLGVKVRGLAEKDEARGRLFSAGEKYRRATIYFVQAERMQSAGFAPRKEAFANMLACFAKFLALTNQNCARCEIPYRGTSLPALYVPADDLAPGQRAPCMVHFDGLDVTKEIIYMLGVPQALARRGISTLVVDNPGVGESLRLKGLHNSPEAEIPAGAAFDFLAARQDVDPARIGIMALSLGGYHAPRVAAFDQRFACCVAWGAQYDWGAIQRARHADTSSNLPVPHYWDHVGWVFGAKTIDEILAVSSKISLIGILDRIRCPILVVHGENDRQIPLSAAKRVVEECVNSPRRELFVHTLADGGAEHCGIDNVALTREQISDWVAETFGGRTGNPAH
jgi:pimeloyl-ACP methyl ester carboxylesterase